MSNAIETRLSELQNTLEDIGNSVASDSRVALLGLRQLKEIFMWIEKENTELRHRVQALHLDLSARDDQIAYLQLRLQKREQELKNLTGGDWFNDACERRYKTRKEEEKPTE